MTNAAAAQEQPTKLPTKAHVMSAWPLALVAIGSAIGGALGGAAYAINIAVYKSKLPVPAKIALNLLSGLAAVVLWAVLVALIKGNAE